MGDPKQSIYKFRRADLVLYRQVRERLEERGVGLVTLKQSYRSVPNIQQFVNAAFETEMSGDVADGHAEWAPLERDREEIPDRPSVIVLPVPRPYKTRLAKEAVAKSLPDAIAAFVDWIVKESGWGYQGTRHRGSVSEAELGQGRSATRGGAGAGGSRGGASGGRVEELPSAGGSRDAAGGSDGDRMAGR